MQIVSVESGEEILLCEKLNKENKLADSPITYDWVYRNGMCDIVTVGKLLDNGQTERQNILENGIT